MFIDLVVGDAAPSRGGFWELAREKGIEHENGLLQPAAGASHHSQCRSPARCVQGEGNGSHSRRVHRPTHQTAGIAIVNPPSSPKLTAGTNPETIAASSKQSLLKRTRSFVAKTGTGFFGITVIDKILTNLGIENLVISGVVTHQCVESTVRGAFDHGFNVILAEDACASISDELHSASLRALGGWFCEVRSTQEILEEVARVEG